MKKILLVLFTILLSCTNTSTPGEVKQKRPLSATVWTASQSWFTINNVASAFRNDGHADRNFNPPNAGSGFFFPKNGNRTVVFDAGVIWTAKLRDTLYVGGSLYLSGLQPGKILSPSIAEDPALPKNRVYRVRPDYMTATLGDETRLEGIPTEQIRFRYALDWNEWPASEGAPFQDRNNNGTYEPATDIPGKPGADQTLWYVANDLDTLLPYPQQSLRRKAMGVELQVTVWGYNRGGVLGNTMFRQYRLVNKSLVPFDSMYVMQWSDPDLGDAGDDFAGCDTTLHLEYVYNAGSRDADYFPMPPPAVGYQFLNVPMISSHYEAAGWTIVFYPDISHQYAPQWNWLNQGRYPWGGAPFIYPNFPEPTRFWLDGDPVAGTGRLDGYLSAASDRRIGSSTGPFRLMPGESKDIVVASLAAMSSNRLSSVALLKKYAGSLRVMFDGISHSVPPKFDAIISYLPQSQATVQLLADGRPTRAQSIAARIFREDGSLVTLVSLFDDGLHGDGGANDGIWGNAVTLNREQAGFCINATAVDSLARTLVWERIYDNISTAGPMRIINPVVFSDNINSDGQVNPRENIRYGFTLSNAGTFPHGGILLSPSFEIDNKVIRLNGVTAGGSVSLTYNPNDTLSYFTFTAPDSGVKIIPFMISDSSSNSWHDTARFVVVPFAQPIRRSIINHVAGITEWEFDVRVVNPSATQNHLYEITLADSLFAGTDTTEPLWTKVINLRDATTGDTLLRRHPLPDEFGHNMPVISGFRVVRGGYFGHVGLRRDSTRWIPEGQAWLKGDGRFSWDPQSAFDGGVLIGFPLSYYLGAIQSSFNPFDTYPVEIRFDAAHPQKAYRLRRIGSYYIQDYVNVPFSAWDVSNRSAPRQITVSWRD